MAIPRILVAAIASSAFIGLSGCAAPQKQLMKMDTNQVNLRSMQTRAFDTTNKIKTLRTVISTLQDLDFLIDETNKVLGLVSATRLTDRLQIKVTVRAKSERQTLVRVNMEYNSKGVEYPSVYRQFFSVLEKSMFLTAHAVD